MTITEEEDSSLGSAHSDIIQQVDKFLKDIEQNKDSISPRNLLADETANKLIGFIDNG
jgi:midasin (ATPase involved in ribosome maturation)